jgi:hypothetical protein
LSHCKNWWRFSFCGTKNFYLGTIDKLKNGQFTASSTKFVKTRVQRSGVIGNPLFVRNLKLPKIIVSNSGVLHRLSGK